MHLWRVHLKGKWKTVTTRSCALTMVFKKLKTVETLKSLSKKKGGKFFVFKCCTLRFRSTTCSYNMMVKIWWHVCTLYSSNNKSRILENFIHSTHSTVYHIKKFQVNYSICHWVASEYISNWRMREVVENVCFRPKFFETFWNGNPKR